jgi:hypothetical protein
MFQATSHNTACVHGLTCCADSLLCAESVLVSCVCGCAGPAGNRTATAKDMRVSTVAVQYAKALRRGQVQVYPTKAECCMPSLGAYANGCSATA